MKIVHVQQPEGSMLCAHACAAMVLGVSLDRAVELIGHTRKTTTRELVLALGECAISRRLQVLRYGLDSLPDGACIVRLRGERASHGHFALKAGEWVHEPTIAHRLPFKPWVSMMQDEGWRITSSLAVELAPR